MRPILLIALKDLILIFRDRAMLLMIVIGPFLLTLGMGLVGGKFSGSGGGSSGPRDIPVVVVNQDGEELGNALVRVLSSPELDDLLAPTLISDPEMAKQWVNEDQMAAAIIVPPGFTRSVFPSAGEAGAWGLVPSSEVSILLYANPQRPNSVAIVESILRAFLFRVEKGRILGWTAVASLVLHGVIRPEQAEAIGRALGELLARAGNTQDLIRVVALEAGKIEATQIDIMTALAPGMALLFLMFTATYGARSLLAERRQQTLQRLMTTPIVPTQILIGKGIGVYWSGVIQQVLLIGASTLLFGLRWGDFWGVFALILCASFAAVGWGLLIAAIARTPGQVASIGSALTLVFGLIGGSFIDLRNLPPAIYWLSRITPNAWGMDGFSILAGGGSLVQIIIPLLALMFMGGGLTAVAGWLLAHSRHLLQV